MVRDCGWIIEYDMLRARYLLAQSGVHREASPEFLLEEGYLSWQGLSPRDHDMNSQLHR